MNVHLTQSLDDLQHKLHLKAYAPIQDRLRSVLLAAQKTSAQKIANLLGYARSTVELWVQRYNQGGEAALWDLPRPGQKKKLSPAQEEQVQAWMTQGPTEEEGRSRYRVEDLQQKIKEAFGVQFSWSGVRYLMVVRLGHRLLRTRPVHEKNDKATMEAWKQEAPFLSSKSKPNIPSKKFRSSLKTKRGLDNKAG